MSISSHSLSVELSADLRALSAQVPDGSIIEAAQQRLEMSIPRRQATRSYGRQSVRLSLAAAAFAAVVVLVSLLPTVFLNQGVAFAEVQKNLRNFKTLTMAIKQSSNGMNLPTIQVLADRVGNVHTNIGVETTVIVNVESGTVLVLYHQSHRALRLSFAANQRPQDNQAFEWLKSVRDFQGHATRLKESRIIDGQTTYGWSSQEHGTDIVLWADNNGIPRFVSVNNGKTLSQSIQIRMDVPIKRELFDTRLPTGYSLDKQD